MNNKYGVKGEKGFVLILALVAMVAMMLIGISLIMNITTDVQLARNEKESMLTFQLAEAGIREASARIHLPSANARYIGEKSTDSGYRTTGATGWSKSFTSSANVIGTLPAGQSYSVVITYLDENNPEGFCDSNQNNAAGAQNNNFNDSITTGTNFALTASTDSGTCTSKGGTYNATTSTCSWTCNNSTSEIVMYGQDFGLSPTVTGIQYGALPVYKVTSTATVNNTTRQVVAYLGESNLNTNTLNAINTNGCVTVSGGPPLTILNEGGTPGQITQNTGCACPGMGTGSCGTPKTTPTNMNTYLGDTIPNIKTYADQVLTCNVPGCATGNPANWNGNLNGVVTSWSGSGTQEGVLLVVDNLGGVTANMNGNVNGEGILIITGNMQITGNVTWEGLIYVMGNLTISGTVNVEGGIMAGNTTTAIVDLNGNVTVKYSPEELAEMARQTSASATTVWKRL